MTLYENPTIAESEKYPLENTIYSKVKGSPYFQGAKATDLNDLKFSEVDKIKSIFKNPDDKGIEDVMRLVYKQKIKYNKTTALEFWRAFNHVKEDLEGIYKLEQKLSSKPNQKLINAGIEKMSIFDTLNLTDDIAKRYHLDPETVEGWKYGKVYIIALKMKYESDIQKNLEDAKK